MGPVVKCSGVVGWTTSPTHICVGYDVECSGVVGWTTSPMRIYIAECSGVVGRTTGPTIMWGHNLITKCGSFMAC